MVKRNKEICIIDDREYLEAENKSYDKLVENGFLPQGADKKFRNVCVMKIENEHHQNEKTDVYHFQNWQEAAETLCKYTDQD